MRVKLIIALCLITILGACNSEKDPIDIGQPTYNLEDVDVSLDKTTVIEGENITFNIEGRGDFLTFYSGEEGRGYPADINGGVKHTGRVDYYTYAFKKMGTYNIHLVFATKDGQERVFGPYEITVEEDPNKEPEPDPNALTEKTMTMVLGPKEGAGEAFLVDLASVSAHSMADASTKQGAIDLLAVWGRPGTRPANSEGWPTFYIIGAASYGGVGIAANALNWATRNTGQIIRLNNPTSTELDQFAELKTRADLEEAYETLADVGQVGSVTQSAGYIDQNTNGPFGSISFKNVVDAVYAANNAAVFDDYKLAQENHESILYFKSTASGRNLFAAFKIKLVKFPTAYGNSIDGELELEVKSFLAP